MEILAFTSFIPVLIGIIAVKKAYEEDNSAVYVVFMIMSIVGFIAIPQLITEIHFQKVLAICFGIGCILIPMIGWFFTKNILMLVLISILSLYLLFPITYVLNIQIIRI